MRECKRKMDVAVVHTGCKELFINLKRFAPVVRNLSSFAQPIKVARNFLEAGRYSAFGGWVVRIPRKPRFPHCERLLLVLERAAIVAGYREHIADLGMSASGVTGKQEIGRSIF